MLSNQFEELRASIEFLASQNDKAKEAVDKVSTLDQSIAQLEKRIAGMNVAREWLARTETELKALDKDAREYLKLTKSLLSRESGKTQAPSSKGAPTPRDRETIMKLKSQGWTVKEIADSLKMSIGEVELTIEIASRGE
jgi:DNA-binding NarL/FixJ family response regulator